MCNVKFFQPGSKIQEHKSMSHIMWHIDFFQPGLEIQEPVITQ